VPADSKLTQDDLQAIWHHGPHTTHSTLYALQHRMKQRLLSPGSFPLQDEYTMQLLHDGHRSLIYFVTKWQGALTCCLLSLLCFPPAGAAVLLTPCHTRLS
jgi:hypothetical protein